MNRSLLTFFLLCSFNFLLAQKEIPEFGKVDISELTMKECAFEKDADAINLIKTAKISFEVNAFTGVPKTYTEYRVRKKIFTEHGFSAANINILYASKSRSSKITDIEAFIYNLDENGKIVTEKVEKNQIFKEKSNTKKSLNKIAFTFPDLKKGSVIEYRYTKVDKYSLRIEPWFFQDVIPTSVSNITAATPAYVLMTYHLLVSNPIEQGTSYKKYYYSMYNEDIRSFTMRNISSFKVEPFMSSLKDNLQRIEFSLSPITSVRRMLRNEDEKMNFFNFLLLNARYFGWQFDKPIEGTEKFIDSVKKLKNGISKIDAIYKYVKKNIEWNNEQTFYCDSIEECWKAKLGSSGEMNILFLNLLRKAEIKCFPILVSTRENGIPDPDFASMSQFNGVDILAVDSNTIYTIDCSQKYLSPQITPFNIMNRYGYIVDPVSKGWFFITDKRILMQNEISIDGAMNNDGTLKGTLTQSFIGFAKTKMLTDQLKNKNSSASDDHEMNDNTINLIIDSVISEKNDEYNDTLSEIVNFHFSPSSTGNIFFINPFMFSSFIKNPFKDTARFSDIDFGCNQSYDILMRIKVPNNFSIEDLPKDVSIQKEDSSALFERSISKQSNNLLLIHDSFILKNAIFPKEDYPALKSFFDKVYTLINEEILLKKNN